MSQNQKPTKAFKLTAASGTLILINGGLLAVVTEWFPYVMPTLPGTTGNDPSMLFSLSAVGLTLGALILLSALMLRVKPANRRIWGTASMAFSVPSVIMGGGFFVGCLMGIYGGVSAIRFKPKNPSAKPKTLFSILLSEKDGMRIEGAGPKIMAPMFLTFGVVALLSWAYTPIFSYPWAYTGWTLWLGVLLLAVGVPFWLLAAAMFLKAWQQGRLETRGPFAIMPNPIYGSFIVFVIPAISLLLVYWPILLTSVVMYLAQRRFIHEEDQALLQKFSKQYIEYRKKVLLKGL